MVQSPSWEANRFAASQETRRISRNPKVHYRTHKRPPPVSILGQPNPVHAPIPLPKDSSQYYPPIYAWVSQWSLSLRFPNQNPVHDSPSLMRATCPAHPILLDFITLTILGEQYRSLSSSYVIFLHSPVTSSHLGPNIPLSPLFSNTLSLRSSLNVIDQVTHSHKTTGEIIVFHIMLCVHFAISLLIL